MTNKSPQVPKKNIQAVKSSLKKKAQIKAAVALTVKHYGKTLELLALT
jgi:hypothetical protein